MVLAYRFWPMCCPFTRFILYRKVIRPKFFKPTLHFLIGNRTLPKRLVYIACGCGSISKFILIYKNYINIDWIHNGIKFKINNKWISSILSVEQLTVNKLSRIDARWRHQRRISSNALFSRLNQSTWSTDKFQISRRHFRTKRTVRNIDFKDQVLQQYENNAQPCMCVICSGDP